jgi:hypothetical protein
MKKLGLFTLAIIILSAFNLQAQTASKVTLAESSKGKLTVSGYVDVYYTYNWNKPNFTPNVGGNSSLPFSNGGVISTQPNNFSNQNPGHIFDIKSNQFSLGLLQTKFAYTTDKSEVVMDLTYGPNAELGQFGNVFGTMMNIKQAYMAYKFTDKLTVTAGQWGTHVGYEYIDAPLNYNYSLSYLFGNGPFYHTGVKAAYAFSDNVGLMAGIVNGWDGSFAFNKHKSAIAQLYLKPTDGFNIWINYIGGDQINGESFPTLGSPNAPIADNFHSVEHLFDLTTTYQVTDKLKFGLNAAHGFSNHLAVESNGSFGYARWGGIALYTDYRFSSFFGLGVRAEHFEDRNGVRYVSAATAAYQNNTTNLAGVRALGAGTYNEFTLTADLRFMDGHFNLKPEIRVDVAGQNSFVKDVSANKPNGVNTNMQITTGIAAIYAF